MDVFGEIDVLIFVFDSHCFVFTLKQSSNTMVAFVEVCGVLRHERLHI